ncbi:radical SAM/SPASM domain-containing protein [Luteolibacter luteus]|uniref:SPASM domain-containing protein n=1 Tax=Luteolibacter luteus TaxID=2728835 RepID=A0A858RK36_9BACT|nr:SPASM domain-containing protein [Luteolibacter luteus]QJE96941.1 SPASM domain-containing protein [Luteolibacter luteus]
MVIDHTHKETGDSPNEVLPADSSRQAAPDPRSFHVFHRGEDFYFFDRVTGTTSVINEELFGFLRMLEEGSTFEEIQAVLNQQYGEEIGGELYAGARDVLLEMSSSGMLRYDPVNVQRQEAELNALWRHKPRRIQLLMAQGCNLGCRYCYAWRNGSNQKETLMGFDVAKRSVDFLVERSGQRPNLQVTFFGGEPLLNKEVLFQVVDYCRALETTTDKRFVFEIITNGTLLTQELVEYLVREKFLLMISMDGWKEMHNYNRPSLDGTDQHEHILAIAQYANRRYEEAGLGRVKVRANLTKQYHDGPAVTKYLLDQGFSHIGVASIEPLPTGIRAPGAMTDAQIDEAAAGYRERANEALEVLERGGTPTRLQWRSISPYLEPPKPASVRGITCGAGRNTAIVDNKGYIFPCHRYEGMENYIIGNVFSGMDYEKTMGYYRKMNRNAMARCHSCWIRDYCSGGCAWLLAKENGEIADPSEHECDRRRQSMETALYVRARLRTLRPEFFTKEHGNLALENAKGICGGGGNEQQTCGSCSGCD